jgi:hypothetical protein
MSDAFKRRLAIRYIFGSHSGAYIGYGRLHGRSVASLIAKEASQTESGELKLEEVFSDRAKRLGSPA